jgi:hypothetical protein
VLKPNISSLLSLEIVVNALYLDFSINNNIVGIHALINGHEYHCVVIRMRCWLMDAFDSILCCSVDSICAFRVGHVHRARYTQTDNYQQIYYISFITVQSRLPLCTGILEIGAIPVKTKLLSVKSIADMLEV